MIPMAGDGAAPPPLSLPGSHFAAALVFFVAGAAGLVMVSPHLSTGAYLLPTVVATTHLFTLGWITTSILGALYQFLPVALGASIRWPRAAQAGLWLYAPGLAAFVAGLMMYRTPLIVAGASMFAAALLLFAMNLALTLRHAPERGVTWWALAAACSYLVLTVFIGWALAANLRWGFMGGARIVALATHLHVALVGWVLMVMVGVGHRLLPMFLLSHGADERPAKAAVALLTVGVAVLFGLHHAPAFLRWIPAGLILAGAAAFLLQARLFWTHRRRREIDPGMRLTATALVLVGSAAAAGVVLLATHFASARLATAYVLLLVLGISLFVAGHYYKIVAFLVWMARFGPLAGRQPVPKVAELYSARWAMVAGVTLTAGAAGLALSVLTGSATAARGATILFGVGALVETAQMVALRRIAT